MSNKNNKQYSANYIRTKNGILDNLSEILESMKNLSINNVNKSGIFPKLFYIYDNNKKNYFYWCNQRY